MLSQQESFKLGEWNPEACRYICLACDRRRVESAIDLDAEQAFPFCPACKTAGTAEVDQLWIRDRDRASWRARESSRWREMWK